MALLKNRDPVHFLAALSVLVVLAGALEPLYFSVLLPIGAAAAGALVFYVRPPLIVPDRLLIAVLIGLLLWCAASLLWSIDPALSLKRLFRVAAIVVLGLALIAGCLAVAAADTARRLVPVLALAWGMGLVALVGKVAFLLWTRAADAASWAGYVPPDIGLGKAGAALTVMAWLVAAGLLAHGRSRQAMAVVALSLVAAVATSLMAALGAWLVACVLAIGARLLRQAVLLRLVWLVPVAVLATPLVLSQIPRDLQPIAGVMPPSVLHRLAIWRFTADRIAERPLTGWGLETSRVIPGGDVAVPLIDWLTGPDGQARVSATQRAEWRAHPPEYLPLHPHNVVLQLWLELGLVGAGLGGLVLVAVLRLILRGSASPGTRMALFGLLGHAMTLASLSFGAWQSWWLSLMWLCGALAVALVTAGPADTPARRPAVAS